MGFISKALFFSRDQMHLDEAFSYDEQGRQ